MRIAVPYVKPSARLTRPAKRPGVLFPKNYSKEKMTGNRVIVK